MTTYGNIIPQSSYSVVSNSNMMASILLEVFTGTHTVNYENPE